MSDLNERRTRAKRKRADICKVASKPAPTKDSTIFADQPLVPQDTKLYNLGCLLNDVFAFIPTTEMSHVLMTLYATGDRNMQVALSFHFKSLDITTCSWECDVKCPCNCLHLPFVKSPRLKSVSIVVRPRPSEGSSWTRMLVRKFRVSTLRQLPPKLQVLHTHSSKWVDGWNMEYSLMVKHMECLSSLVYLKLQLLHRSSDCLDFSDCVNLKTLILHCKERDSYKADNSLVKWILPEGLEAFSGISHPSNVNVNYFPSSLTAIRCGSWNVTSDICAQRMPSLTYLSVKQIYVGGLLPNELPSTLLVLQSDSSIRLSHPLKCDSWPSQLSDVQMTCLSGNNTVYIPYGISDAQRESGQCSAFPPSTTALRTVSGPHINRLEDWRTLVAEPCFTNLVVLSLDVAVTMDPSPSTIHLGTQMTFGDLHTGLKRCAVLEDLTTKLRINTFGTGAVPLICTRTVKKCRVTIDTIGDLRPSDEQGQMLSLTWGGGFDDFSSLSHLCVEQNTNFGLTSFFDGFGVGMPGPCTWTADASTIGGVKLSPSLVLVVVRKCRPPITAQEHDLPWLPRTVRILLFNGEKYSPQGEDDETIAIHTCVDLITGVRKTEQLFNYVIEPATQRNPFVPPKVM